MHKSLFVSVFTYLLLLHASGARAQSDVIKLQSCETNPYLQSIDSLKKLYSSEGYIVLREASITMESEYEMPVVLPMQAGTVYQFIFIGDPTS